MKRRAYPVGWLRLPQEREHDPRQKHFCAVPKQKKIKIKFQKQNRKFSVISTKSSAKRELSCQKHFEGDKKKSYYYSVLFFFFFFFYFFAGHKRSDLHHRHAIGSSACRKEKNRFFIELVFFFFTNNFFEKKALPFSPNQMGKLRGNQRGTSSPD